jgi:hypothetical protein
MPNYCRLRQLLNSVIYLAIFLHPITDENYYNQVTDKPELISLKNLLADLNSVRAGRRGKRDSLSRQVTL